MKTANGRDGGIFTSRFAPGGFCGIGKDDGLRMTRSPGSPVNSRLTLPAFCLGALPPRAGRKKTANGAWRGGED